MANINKQAERGNDRGPRGDDASRLPSKSGRGSDAALEELKRRSRQRPDSSAPPLPMRPVRPAWPANRIEPE